MKLFILLISLSLFSFCDAQVCEYPIDSSKIGVYQQYVKKYHRKVRKHKYFKSDLKFPSFEIANYLRQNNYPTYEYWYGLTIENLKNYYKKVVHKMKPEILYWNALSYYYLRDFEQASSYFQKSLKAQVHNIRCCHYYLSLCYKELGKIQEAETEMKIFEEDSK